MRFTILYLTVLLCHCSISQSMDEVRTAFHKAVLEPRESKVFHASLADLTISDPTMQAYKAASEAMLAQVVWNPFVKLSQVFKFGDLMEMAVLEEPENIEIRFLRLAIEYNLPRFLGRSNHLQEDRDVIVGNIGNIDEMEIDPSFTRYIIYFLRDTKLCSEKEIIKMENGLADD